jgi:hypothetical protein
VELSHDQQEALTELRAERAVVDEFRVWLRSLVRRAAQLGLPWAQIAEELGLRSQDVFVMVSGVDAESSSWTAGLAVVHPDRPLRVAVARTDARSRVTGEVIAGVGHIDPVTGYLSLSIRGSHARFENARLGDWLDRAEAGGGSPGLPWLNDDFGPEAEHRLLLVDAPLDERARSLAAMVGAIHDAAMRDAGGDE